MTERDRAELLVSARIAMGLLESIIARIEEEPDDGQVQVEEGRKERPVRLARTFPMAEVEHDAPVPGPDHGMQREGSVARPFAGGTLRVPAGSVLAEE